MAEEKEAKKDVITKDMSMMEVLSKHQGVAEVFMQNGLHCVGCAAAQFETIEQGAQAHGIDVDKLIDDLNKAIEKEKKEE